VAAHERIVSTAYALFTWRGVRAVGIDEIISQSGAAKATMFRHFRTKNDLLAALQRRERCGPLAWSSSNRGCAATPPKSSCCIFDVFHDWFRKCEDFDGCSFTNVLIELGPPAGQHPIPGQHPLDRAPTRRNRWPARPRQLRPVVAHPDEGLHHLRRRTDLEAAHRAQDMACTLIEQHRRPADS
jgi:AcrR family transcriptional regulator